MDKWGTNQLPEKKLHTRLAFAWPLGSTHPDPGLCEVGPHGYLLPRAHVRVAIPLESGFKLLQLLAGEVSPLSPLPLLFRRVVRGVVVLVLYLFFFCKEEMSRFGQGEED